MAPGTLYVVATPIGNLGDLSPRGRQVLAEVDVIAAEDTRHAGHLLTGLGIRTRLVSLHEQNEAARSSELVDLLREGRSVALVSDAGTPLISDPGYRLLAAARAAGLPVSPIPGPCAAIAALSVAGLPTDRFHFEGFLPAKGSARRTRLAALADRTESLVFYESVHRITETLADAVTVLGADRPAALGRELTKLHETLLRGTLAEIAVAVAGDPASRRGSTPWWWRAQPRNPTGPPGPGNCAGCWRCSRRNCPPARRPASPRGSPVPAASLPTRSCAARPPTRKARTEPGLQPGARDASKMLWMEASMAASNSASDCWAVRPSTSAREKLAIMPRCRARRRLASSRL